jgi:SAM-dependent methyltransferase
MLGSIVRRIYPTANARIRLNRLAVCTYLLATDRANAMLFSLGYIAATPAEGHTSRPVDESVAYVVRVFEDYKHYSGITRFHGRATEVGPGDNCGVGLMFLVDGCDRVDLLDRFYWRRDQQKQSRIYERLLELYPQLAARRRAPSGLLNESTFDGIHCYYGKEASAESFFQSSEPYDFIFSRATFEHLIDPCAVLRSMARALKPGGMLLHEVDLRTMECSRLYFMN